MVGCSSSSAPPLVASGGSLSAGGSSPYIPPCTSTVDAGGQNGAFLDASPDTGPQGTLNPTTPSDAGVPFGIDGSVNTVVDSGTPCPR